MLKKISKHIAHFTPLIGILVISFIGYLAFSYDKTFQIAVVIAASVAYVTWGLIHHHLHDEIYAQVILEYIAIAVLGMVIGLSLILTA